MDFNIQMMFKERNGDGPSGGAEVQCSIVHGSKVQSHYSAIQSPCSLSAVLSAVHCRSVQCITFECSAVQYGACTILLYCTVQYCTAEMHAVQCTLHVVVQYNSSITAFLEASQEARWRLYQKTLMVKN